MCATIDQVPDADHCVATEVVWGQSAEMRNLFQMIKRVALVDKPVLISGPTGSGKEVIAKLIHDEGPHARSPFIPINCAAIPETLFESELFGHEKGAFTGATQSREGYMNAVKRGTLFLDEIADLSLTLQTKILRVLEIRSFTPVGSIRARRMRGRIISASYKNIEAMVADSLFREDLYHRLNVFEMRVPSLSERRGDIPAFVEYFSRKQHRKLRFTKEALAALQHAEWPGNVRQLRNTIDRIAVLTDDDPVTKPTVERFIDYQVLSSSDALDTAVDRLLELDIENIMVSVEYRLIDQALQKHGGNKCKAAKMLGIHRKCVERRILALDNNWAEIDKGYYQARKNMADSKYREASIGFKKTLNYIARIPHSKRLEELKLEAMIALSVCLRTLDGWKNPDLLELYSEALQIGQRIKKTDSLAPVYFGLWANHLVDLELDKALYFAHEYLNQGKELGSQEIVVSAYIAIANSYLWMGDFRQCLSALEEFNRLYHNDKDACFSQGVNLYVYYLMFHGVLLYQLGKLDQVQKLRRELELFCHGCEHAFTTAIAFGTSAWLSYLFEDWENCMYQADRAVTIAEENAFCFYHGFGLVFKGYIVGKNGEREIGKNMIFEGYSKMSPHGGRLFNSMINRMVGELYHGAENLEEGLGYIQTGIDVAKKYKEMLYLPELLCTRSRYQMLRGDREAAESDLREAISHAERLESFMGELKAVNQLSELYMETGDAHRAYSLAAQMSNRINFDMSMHNEFRRTMEVLKGVEQTTQ